ncbi:MAG: MarR family transcriptional regulator [Syntrophales bacterium]|nr:MarR family transcriptional regulator [Syntrophales bacterium]MCK9392479.1 MarR family transcriptional regulator [Syntrophales bacterium]
MDEQARQLAGMVENIMYFFGTQSQDGECCENISHGEFRALHTALHQSTCTMQDIAKKAVVTKSGATRIVHRLEEKGLAHREEDQKDGRVCCVTLTEAGVAFLNRIEDQLTNKMQTILVDMDPAMREILIISLGAFLQIAQGQMSGRDKRPEAD